MDSTKTSPYKSIKNICKFSTIWVIYHLIVCVQISVICLYVVLSLLTQLHEDDGRQRKGTVSAPINYRDCDILMLHMGSPDNINHLQVTIHTNKKIFKLFIVSIHAITCTLQACSIESVANHHSFKNVCLAIYVS